MARNNAEYDDDGDWDTPVRCTRPISTLRCHRRTNMECQLCLRVCFLASRFMCDVAPCMIYYTTSGCKGVHAVQAFSSSS